MGSKGESKGKGRVHDVTLPLRVLQLAWSGGWAVNWKGAVVTVPFKRTVLVHANAKGNPAGLE